MSIRAVRLFWGAEEATCSLNNEAQDSKCTYCNESVLYKIHCIEYVGGVCNAVAYQTKALR